MKEKRLIAIGADDEGRVWMGHFGISPYYLLYDAASTLHEKRLNPYGPKLGEHKHHDSPGQIVELLSDCSVFIGHKMGNKERLTEQYRITAVLTDERDPASALQEFLHSP